MMKAWDVVVPIDGYEGEDGYGSFFVMTEGKRIDTVYFDKDCDRQYVRRSLIEHDNYPSNIMVYEARKRQR